MDSRFLLFTASAGSGKTFNLAIQYIALLLAHGEHAYRHTLAVTFTNKATAEMKDRILDYLYYIWKGLPKGRGPMAKAKEVMMQQYHTSLTDEEIRERCHKALHAILHDYSRFYISTIDAFFQYVLRNMAHELGLTAHLQADINTERMVEMAVDNLLESLQQDNRDVLPWLRNYIEQRLNDSKSWDIRGELKHMAGLLFEENYLKRSLDDANQPLTIEHISHFKKILEERRKSIVTPLLQAASEYDKEVHRTGWDYETLFNNGRYVRGYVQKLKDEDFNANFSATLQNYVDDSQKMLNKNLRNDSSMLGLAAQFSSRLGQLHDMQLSALRDINSIDIIVRNLNPMGLLGAIDAEVTRISKEYNRFMLARTPIMLKRMIQGEDASFIFERIGAQFDNIMIDEFQDTSRLQWENFRTLLLDNLANGGLGMIVGDIKQSIYRFRNGDWTILHELSTKGQNGYKPTKETLKDNYRSRGHIIEFNNQFFPLAAKKLDQLSEEDMIKLADLYRDVEQGKKRDTDSGFVRIRLCQTRKREQQEAWQEDMLADMSRQVEILHRDFGIPYGKMTILVRYSRYIEPIIKYFSLNLPHVRLVSNEAFLLRSSIAVSMIVNALQVVDDPERDPVALYRLVLDYRRHICKNTAPLPPCPYEKPCQPKGQDGNDAGDARDSLVTDYYLSFLPEELAGHLESLRKLPIYELCETLFRLMRLEHIVGEDAYLLTFFDELSVYLRDNPSDIPSFITYWGETMAGKAIPNGEVEGIRIFTIHKSKGLAFHTVLMPFAEWQVEHIMSDALFWCTPKEQPYNQMGSLPVALNTTARESVFSDDYRLEHCNLRADELNSLYVAFTRAEDNLFVWGLSKGEMEATTQSESVADVMQACLPEMEGMRCEQDDEDSPYSTYIMGEHPSTVSDKEDTAIPTIDVLMRSYLGSLSFRQSSEASEFVRDAENHPSQEDGPTSYIEQGKLLHYVFSQIETANDIPRITELLGRRGILKSERQVEQVRKLASQGLRHERVRDWLSGKYRLFNECSILIPDQAGKLLKRRPDRVMISDDRIIIVDFKFGTAKEEYHEQVRQYMQILQAMYPEKQVEGWLWYVYKNKIESV